MATRRWRMGATGICPRSEFGRGHGSESKLGLHKEYFLCEVFACTKGRRQSIAGSGSRSQRRRIVTRTTEADRDDLDGDKVTTTAGASRGSGDNSRRRRQLATAGAKLARAVSARQNKHRCRVREDWYAAHNWYTTQGRGHNKRVASLEV